MKDILVVLLRAEDPMRPGEIAERMGLAPIPVEGRRSRNAGARIGTALKMLTLDPPLVRLLARRHEEYGSWYVLTDAGRSCATQLAE